MTNIHTYIQWTSQLYDQIGTVDQLDENNNKKTVKLMLVLRFPHYRIPSSPIKRANIDKQYNQ